MIKAQLTVNGETRSLSSFKYEYFQPVRKSEEKYRKILQKNFPYDFPDKQDLFPYYSNNLPTLKNDALAQRLREKAYFDAYTLSDAGMAFNRKSKKDYYYDKLTELRYHKSLDRNVIPNLYDFYDMEARPSETIGRFPVTLRIIGGIFDVEFDSMEHDDIFYQWLSSGEMKNGEFTFWQGDSMERYFKIKFWDCYCIEIGESLMAYSPLPMKMHIRMSPAITENRGIKHEKCWKVSDIRNQPFKTNPTIIPYVASDTTIRIIDAYWINEEGNKQRESFPDYPVTLFIKLANPIVGTTVDLKFRFEENGVYKCADYSGTVGIDGLITLTGFKFETSNQENE